MKPIYIFGHRHPDNDSIVSAVAYAYLKNITDPENTYVAARLGPMPRETQWLFDKYGIEAPELIEHIRTRVGDVMQTEVISVDSDTGMQTASRIMRRYDLRTLPVLDHEGYVQGLLSYRTLALCYLQEIIDHTDHFDGMVADLRIHKITNLMETVLEVISPENLLEDTVNILLDSPDRELIVTDDEGRCVGVLTRTDVVRGDKRRCILVDHNEMSQSAPGIADAEVLEILDHHRVGDIQTSGPILFYNIPIGSTASIVTLRYQDAGVEIPEPMAAILLSAILTDTVILKSPTATEIDRALVKMLSEIVGVDYEEYGLEVLKARNAGEELMIDDILNSDLKEYRVDDRTVAIVQYETVDLNPIKERHKVILDTMVEHARVRNYDTFVFMATDIIAEGSEIFVVGDIERAEKALDIDLASGSAWMDGVLSRKKQVAPAFME
ncbi:MAG: putative manganese-dependent inorganic diphosphatase [Coriobacteriia bacterium]|nr:putative manganese-dependent inorganic diphosphatase [Coriobacteriia bacterium]